MTITMRTCAILFAAISLLSISAYAQFTNGQAADVVLGQGNFTSNTSPGATNASTFAPQSVAVFPGGKIFVADIAANRVLRWPSAPANGSAAEAVFGQANFTDNTAAVTETRLDVPYSLAIDSLAGNRLWVADLNANRVLRFDNPSSITSGAASANGVLGEPNFTTGGGGTTASTMISPTGVAITQEGTLYVADQTNNRVLRFDNAAGKANGAAADCVLGQANFLTAGVGCTSTTMTTPTTVAVDFNGTLYVVDQGNNRVLRFDNADAKTNGAAADGVIGQIDFVTGTAGTSAGKFNSPYGAVVDGSGRLYISDQLNNRILYFNTPSSIVTGGSADGVLGQANFTGASPATTAAGLDAPAGLAIDNAYGKLWVAELNNNRVIRYSASSSPLPVEVTSFTATPANGRIELIWATATESNNYGFDVERRAIKNQSTAIEDWAKIGFVQGHGSTNAPQSYSFTDASARFGKYSYRLKQIDRNGRFEYHQAVEATVGITPNTVWLDNNYPNPFNPSTKISFVLGTTGHAVLSVYNLLGERIATLVEGQFGAGEIQTVTFDASAYASGIYYYQLKSGSSTEIKKMMLLK